MKNKYIWIIISVVIFIGALAYYLYMDNVADNGRVYSSKVNLCQQFAQSYLRTIPKTDNIQDYGSEKWKMAVDVETDMYNLCLTDLNKESLKNYKTSAIEKYQK